MDFFRIIGPLALAVLTALWIDHSTERRGLLPPRFSIPGWRGSPWPAMARRYVAGVAIAVLLWIGVFAPLGSLGIQTEIDVTSLSRLDLFVLHLWLALTLVLWYVAGFVPRRSGDDRRNCDWRSQLGLRAASIGREIGIGLIVGVGAWLVVLAVLIGVALTIWWLGGEELLPQEPPPLIPWIAGLPIAMRLAISLSAGVFEEAFFRGFLQPRVGLTVSTLLFVLAHASYDQPFMLLGVGLLSLIYGGLVVWRQSIWAAIAAHTLFDAVQLLVVIPAALDVLPSEIGAEALARSISAVL